MKKSTRAIRTTSLAAAGLSILLGGCGPAEYSSSDPSGDPANPETQFEIQAIVGKTYQVGPGKAYANLQAVAGLLAPGDVVEVYGGTTYAGGVVFTKAGTASAPITIRGVRVSGKRPVLSGGTNTVEFRADNYVFEGFDATGGTSRVLYHHAHNITIRDTVVHDCPSHGILGADEDSGSLTLDYVEVYKCGAGDTRHPIYIATDPDAHPGSVFRMQHCYVHDGNGGNNVKSRAERNEIYYNWIEGGFYRELELIGSETYPYPRMRNDSDVVGNVFVKRQGTYVARIGGDSPSGDSGARYRFVNNTFILQAGSNAAIQAYARLQSLEMHNNVFYRVGGGAVEVIKDSDATWIAGKRIVAGQRNWVPTGSSGLAELTNTLTGSTPGLVNASGNDMHLASGSAAIDAGTNSPVGPSGYAFPSPLSLPTQLPPQRVLEAPGAGAARPAVGTIDLGAFEAGRSGGNAAPQVSLTGPAAGSGLTAPATVTLSANASDSDGSVAKVEFFANGSLVGTDTAAPYSATWSGVAAGTYQLTARATDNAGAQTTSAAVSITVGGGGGGGGAPSCLTSSGTRQNLAFAARTGSFTAEADVTPSAANIDGAVALSSGQQGAWAGLAAIVLFGPNGQIVARNGGSYPASTQTYQAGKSYHVRMVANVSSKTYSVYVRPSGGTEVLLGSNLAFRTEQKGVSSLDNWDVRADVGSIQACNLTIR